MYKTYPQLSPARVELNNLQSLRLRMIDARDGESWAYREYCACLPDYNTLGDKVRYQCYTEQRDYADMLEGQFVSNESSFYHRLESKIRAIVDQL